MQNDDIVLSLLLGAEFDIHWVDSLHLGNGTWSHFYHVVRVVTLGNQNLYGTKFMPIIQNQQIESISIVRYTRRQVFLLK